VSLDGGAAKAASDSAGLTHSEAALAEGVHTLKVRSIDEFGHVSDRSESVSVEIDLTAPIQPSNANIMGSTPTNDPRPVWMWEESTSIDVVGYEVIINAGPVIPLGIETNYVPIADLPEGFYTLFIRAVDAAGNVSTWTVAPQVEIDLTAPGAPTGLNVDETPTTNTRPTWTWTAPADADLAGFKVSLDGEAWIDVGMATSYQPIEPLTDGTHSLRVLAYDDAGNESAIAGPVSVFIDTYVGPPAGLRLTGPNPTNTTVEWVWEAPGDADLAGYELLVDETYPVIAQAAVDTDYSADFTDGNHSLRVRAYDSLGNRSTWTSIVGVTVDKTAPGAPTMRPVVSPTNQVDILFSWNAPDDHDVARYEVSLDDGAPVNVSMDTSYLALGLSEGTHTLKARAVDTTGNIGPWSGNAVVVIDLTAPVITFLNPTDGAEFNITTSSMIIIQIDGEFDDETIRFKTGTSGWLPPTAIIGNLAFYFMEVPFSAFESHTVSAKVDDNVGNEEVESITFEVDNYRDGFGFGRFRFPTEPIGLP